MPNFRNGKKPINLPLLSLREEHVLCLNKFNFALRRAVSEEHCSIPVLLYTLVPETARSRSSGSVLEEEFLSSTFFSTTLGMRGKERDRRTDR